MAPSPDEDEEETSTLAIFPLENVVLLPLVQVPLHIFEPRYRQMTRAALDGDRRIGMAVVRPESRDQMREHPELFPIGCEGVITRCEELPDGRFNLMLQGRRRFRILEEAPLEGDRLFRSARVQPLEDAYPEEDRAAVAQLRNELIEKMRELVKASAAGRGLDEDALGSIDDTTLVNALTQSLDFGAVEKQGVVEADSIRERYVRLIGLLHFRLAELHGGRAPGRGTVH